MCLLGCGRLDFEKVPGDAAFDAPASDGPRWTLVQFNASTSNPTAIGPTAADDLVVVAIHVANTGVVQTLTDDAGTTYLPIASARATNVSPPDAIEVWYAPRVSPGATMLAVTASAAIVAIVMWEVGGLGPTLTIDTTGTLDDQPATTTPMGPALTTTAAGDFAAAVAIVANGVSGTQAGNAFTNDSRIRGNGWAHLADPRALRATYQAIWDQGTAGTYCATGVAFKR